MTDKPTGTPPAKPQASKPSPPEPPRIQIRPNVTLMEGKEPK
jgi:hypothetical protein